MTFPGRELLFVLSVSIALPTSALAQPLARRNHALAYDSNRDRVVLFGGQNGNTILSDIWEWDGFTGIWTQRSPASTSNSPSGRYDHSMAFDSARKRLVVFGGFDGAQQNDTWEWDGSNWSKRSPTNSPQARYRHAMVFDASRNHILMFGGINSSAFRDTWQFNGTNWTDVTPAGSLIPSLFDQAMAFDSSRNRVVLFGGLNSSQVRQNDVWEWNGSTYTWTLNSSLLTSPSARSEHAMAYDLARKRMLVFGGFDGTATLQDTWEFDSTTASWLKKTPANSPPARSQHAMLYDSARRKVVLFGGKSASGGDLNDTWEWDGTTWIDRTVSSVTPTVASVEITAPQPQIPAKGTATFSAKAYDASRTLLNNVTFSWSVTGGGTIGANGVFTAPCQLTTVTITATAVGTSIKGTANVTIIPGALDAITVSPFNPTVATNSTTPFTAAGKDNCGNTVSPPPSFTWSVSSGAGSISASGVLTTQSTSGNFTVTAASAGKTGSTNVIVQPPPPQVASLTLNESQKTLRINETFLFVATVKDSSGNVMTGQNVQFTIEQGGGIIHPYSGLFTAGTGANTFNNTVKATLGTFSDTASITVLPGPVAKIDVSPPFPEVAPRGTVNFTAVMKDSGGNLAPEPLTWEVLNPTAGSISSNGQFTASATSGVYTNVVRAKSANNIQGLASLTIKTTALSNLVVTPPVATLSPLGVETFTVQALDANGVSVAVTPTFSVVAGGGTIDASTGRFVADTVAKTYSQTVKATASGVSATATVIIQPGPVATIEVTPPSTTLSPAGSTAFTAKPKDAFANVVSATPSWSALPSAGTITPGGVFTASNQMGNYPAAITATIGSVTQRADVTIQPGAPSRIDIQPPTQTVQVRGSVGFSAVVKDASGNVLPVTPTFTVEAGGGSITSAGLFTAAETAGIFSQTVKASYQGVSNFATVVVEPGPLASIDLTPTSARVGPGGKTTFTAKPKDAYGNAINLSLAFSAIPEAGKINSVGEFTASPKAGNYPAAVKASSGAISSTANVIIDNAAPVKLVITPAEATVRAGEKLTFRATGEDQFGNNSQVTPSFSIVKEGGSIQSSTGEFTAGSKPGTYVKTIRAEANGVTAFATVKVTPGALALIEVKPNVADVKQGEQQVFEARAKDAFGNDVLDAPKVTWSALPAAGAITSEGVFTAGRNTGIYEKAVTASIDNLQGAAKVHVLSNAALLPDGGIESSSDELSEKIVATPESCGSCQSSTGTMWVGLIGLGALARRRRAIFLRAHGRSQKSQ